MRGRRGTKWLIVAMVCLVGAVCYQTPGCVTLGVTQAVSAINFCSILDCQNGLFGGAIRLCGNPGDPTDDVLADCP